MSNSKLNLLFNGDFDGEFRRWRGTAELTLATGWAPWHVERGNDEQEWQHRRPVYGPIFTQDDSARVRTGSSAQHYHSCWGAHVAGLWQQVVVSAGARLRFSAWGQVWSSDADHPRPSQNPTMVPLCVGVDPRGGTDPLAASVQWSDRKHAIDEWIEFAYDFTAVSDLITVFLRSAPRFPKKQQHVFWDEAQLELLELSDAADAPTHEQAAELKLSFSDPEEEEAVLVKALSPTEYEDVGLLLRGSSETVLAGEPTSSGRQGDAFYWEFSFNPSDFEADLVIFAVENQSRILAWRPIAVSASDEVQEQAGDDAPIVSRQYRRTYVLLPPTADQSWAEAAMRGGFNTRFTVGFSPDDAGLGDLPEKRVIAVNPHHWLPELTAAWFDGHYPGVKFYPLIVESPTQLERELRAWRC